MGRVNYLCNSFYPDARQRTIHSIGVCAVITECARGGGFSILGSMTDVWCRHPSVFPTSLVWCGLASPQLSILYLHREALLLRS